MATPQVQTVQNNPLQDLQKYLPIIQTMLQNKAANRLAQKNEAGQLIQSKMKQMESGFTEEDQKQLSLMMSNYNRMKTTYGISDAVKGIFGGGQPDMTQMIASTAPQAKQTLPTATAPAIPPSGPTVEGKPSPEDVKQGTVEDKIASLWNPEEFNKIRSAVYRQPVKAGQPVIGGATLQKSEQDADTLAKQIYLKVIESRMAQGGMSGSGYYIPRGVDSTGRVVMSHSKSPGLMYEDGTPFRGGALKPLTLGKTPASAIEKQSLSNELLTEASKIEKLYKPKFVGPIAGRYASAKEATVGLEPEHAEFNAMVRKLSDDVLRIKSGAQINEQEMQRMLSFLINTNVPPSVYEARFKIFKSWLADKIKIYNQNMAAGGYMTTGEGVTTPSAPKEDPLGLR